MRNLFISLILLVFTTIFGERVFAQVNVSISDIAKIHLIDGAGYLGGFYRNDYDLLPEAGQWKSYQTREAFERINPRARSRKDFRESRDSIEHRYIKVVSDNSIVLLLKTLRTIKPQFTPADLKINIAQLTQQVDTAFLKHMDPKRVALFNSFFNTPAKLYRLLDTMQHAGWTDDSPYSIIEIIKKGGDTIKVITTRQVDYMQPWQINNVPTYDMGINTFFINATGLKDHRMTGKYLSSQVYESVYFFYARNAFELLHWQETAPENLKFIRRHFDIISISANNDRSSYSFHPKQLSRHVIINGALDIGDRPQLEALARFAEDTLRRFLKNGGFMIDSCLVKPGCTISVGTGHGQASYYLFGPLQKGLAEFMKKYRPEELKPFSIKAGERTEDSWITLPDGKFVLTDYVDDYAVGVLPKYLTIDGNKMRKFVFMVFTSDGKLILKGGG